MFFQVIKKNKKAQSTVEYVLLIAALSAGILSLLSYSGKLDQKLSRAKSGMVDKLSGGYELKRSDFFSENIKKAGLPEGVGGAGGGGGGRGGGGGGGTNTAQTQAAAKKAGLGAAGAGDKEEGDQTPTQDIQMRNAGGQYEIDEAERMRMAESYNGGAKKNEVGAEAGKEEGGATAEEGRKEGEKGGISLKKRAADDEIYGRKKTLAEKDWSLGKIIIIIMVVFFFIFIIIKAKQRRD